MERIEGGSLVTDPRVVGVGNDGKVKKQTPEQLGSGMAITRTKRGLNPPHPRDPR